MESNAAADKAWGREREASAAEVKGAAGASLALGGCGILAWHHWATFASFDCLGGGWGPESELGRS